MNQEQALRINAVSAWLPQTAQAFKETPGLGLTEPSTLASEGYRALITSDLPGPKMAVEAAGKALTTAGVDAGRVPLLLHAWIYYQEHEFWSPAQYVARMLGAKTATSISVQQLCSGGATAIELAASWMSTSPASSMFW